MCPWDTDAPAKGDILHGITLEPLKQNTPNSNLIWTWRSPTTYQNFKSPPMLSKVIERKPQIWWNLAISRGITLEPLKQGATNSNLICIWWSLTTYPNLKSFLSCCLDPPLHTEEGRGSMSDQVVLQTDVL